MFPMPWNTRAQSGRSRLMPKLFGKICRIIEFQAGSCLYVTAAVQAGLTPQRGQSDQSFLRFVGKCLPEAQSDEFLPTYHCRFTASRSYFNPSHQCPELRKKECLPSGRRVCVCVTLGIIGILLDLLRLFSYTFVLTIAGGCRGFPWSASNEDTMDFL